jgi:Dodecin
LKEQTEARFNRALLGRMKMAESVYKVIELIGTSTESWEKAAKAQGCSVLNTERRF